MRTLLYHGSCIDPTHQSHALDLTPDLPFPITQGTIRLLVNDIDIDHMSQKTFDLPHAKACTQHADFQ